MNRSTLLPFALAVLMIGAVGCASSGDGSGQVPQVTVVQTSKIAHSELAGGTGLPVDYRLSVTNPLAEPVKLLMVEVESVGDSGAYQLKRVRHNFNENIAGNSTGAFEFRVWVQPLQSDTKGGVGNPVMLRGTALFEGPAGPIRRNFVARPQ